MPAFKDYTGRRFNKWVVLKRIQMRPSKFLCKCDCGNESEVFMRNLVEGLSTKCMECQALSRSEKMVGKKFRSLTILSVEKVNGKVKCRVKCACGNETYLSPGVIQKTPGEQINGKYISCGKCEIARKRPRPNVGCLRLGYTKGRLTIIKYLGEQKALARCECGVEKVVTRNHMLIPSPSCGCHITDRNIENAKRLEGTTFFYLKILKFLRMGDDKRSIYLIKCKCGERFEQSISYLFGSKSCGCLQKEMVLKGSKNTNSKLKESDVISMRELFNANCYTRKELSSMYDVSYEHVCSLIKGKGWKHV